MRTMRGKRPVVLPSLLALLLLTVCSCARKTITSPKQQFGFEVGADYQLINYTTGTVKAIFSIAPGL